MTEPTVTIHLDDNGRARRPGETLAGEYRLNAVSPDEIRAIEVSVLWCTDGKGDNDMAVHYFRRLSDDDDGPADLRRAGRFSTALPNSPLSYDGALIKLGWSVRVRAFLTSGKELFAEQPFRLGCVPAVREETT